jgi:hypothetical protein
MKTKNKARSFGGAFLTTICAGLSICWFLRPSTTVPAWPKETEALTTLAQQYGIKRPPQSHWVVLVSVGGCGGCLNQLLKFMSRHQDDPRYIFIVPARSRKDFALDIPSNIRLQKNVFRDSLETCYRDNLLQPPENTVYQVEHGRVTKKIVLTPDNIAEQLLYLEGNGLE